jgi:hypothetical protein
MTHAIVKALVKCQHLCSNITAQLQLMVERSSVCKLSFRAHWLLRSRCHVHSAAAVLQSLSKSLLQLAAAAANQLPTQQQQLQMRLRLPAQCRHVRRGGGGSEAAAPHRFGATGFCNL